MRKGLGIFPNAEVGSATIPVTYDFLGGQSHCPGVSFNGVAVLALSGKDTSLEA